MVQLNIFIFTTANLEAQNYAVYSIQQMADETDLKIDPHGTCRTLCDATVCGQRKILIH
jgi:hypothetical protein